MSPLEIRFCISAALVVAILVLLVVFRGRLRTAWNGHVLSTINFLSVGAAVISLSPLVRMYLF